MRVVCDKILWNSDRVYETLCLNGQALLYTSTDISYFGMLA